MLALQILKMQKVKGCLRRGSLTGIAEVITEKNALKRFWKDVFAHYYPAGPDDENYCLISFSAKRAKLWIDGLSSFLSF